MTTNPTPPSGEAEALPKVAWHVIWPEWSQYHDEGDPLPSDWDDEPTEIITLTPHAPAQAAIVALRAEVDQVRRKWLGHRDTGHLSLIEAADKIVGDLHAEIERLTRERDSALTNYSIQKRERTRLEGELTACEARIRMQRAEINRLAVLARPPISDEPDPFLQTR